MQTTFILKDMANQVYIELAAMSPLDACLELTKWANDTFKHCVKVKHGNGTFGDRVRWNQVMRDVVSGDAKLALKFESRRGYKLITCERAPA